MEDCGGGGGGGGRGEEYKSFGGICNSSMLPSNILITLFIEGLLTGSVCVHHNPAITILLTISIPFLLSLLLPTTVDLRLALDTYKSDGGNISRYNCQPHHRRFFFLRRLFLVPSFHSCTPQTCVRSLTPKFMLNTSRAIYRSIPLASGIDTTHSVPEHNFTRPKSAQFSIKK